MSGAVSITVPITLWCERLLPQHGEAAVLKAQPAQVPAYSGGFPVQLVGSAWSRSPPSAPIVPSPGPPCGPEAPAPHTMTTAWQGPFIQLPELHGSVRRSCNVPGGSFLQEVLVHKSGDR